MEIKEISNRGLGVVATRPLKAGEVILAELPILVYPQASALRDVCSFCMRWLSSPLPPPPSQTSCPSCQNARFCSPTCAAAATADHGSHSPLICKALSACNTAGLSDEDQTCLHFLIRASSLLLAALANDPSSASRSSQLTSLAGRPPSSSSSIATSTSTTHVRTHELHGRLRHALTVAGADPSGAITADIVAAWIERDEVNAYGILVPIISDDIDGSDVTMSGSDTENDVPATATVDGHKDRNTSSEGKRLRGSALYATASRINHECLPNTARFDAFDAGASVNDNDPPLPPGSNTSIILKTMHALPAGEEITQSYFPLTWSFGQRQHRCREQYGFVCRCPRCREEATWPEEESNVNAYAEDVGRVPRAGNEQDEVDPGYIHVFLFKYVCPKPWCEGTMAPVSISGGGAGDVLQCNVCEGMRTEAEFLAELEANS